MFSGIIETLGYVKSIEEDGTNKVLEIESRINAELYIDQSISHNGVCLTVVKITDKTYTVEAIEETLLKSNIGHLEIDDLVNLERASLPTTRMDGHIVQGHVDCTAKCIDKETLDGSWYFRFQFPKEMSTLIVDKGSICVNGVSLTVVDPSYTEFSVAIIPYTYENTTFKSLEKGDTVNLEFDIIGKYVARYLERINVSR